MLVIGMVHCTPKGAPTGRELPHLYPCIQHPKVMLLLQRLFTRAARTVCVNVNVNVNVINLPIRSYVVL